MSKKKYPKNLIIGGSGFVGSNLISKLNPTNCINLDKIVSPFFPSISLIGNIRNTSEIIIEKVLVVLFC